MNATSVLIGAHALSMLGFASYAALPPELRGAALGLYSLAGFTGGMVGPSLFGLALDLAGGEQSVLAWAWGYAAIGAGCLAAPLVVRAFRTARVPSR